MAVTARRIRPSTAEQIRVAETTADLERLAPAWRRLWRATPGASPMLEYEWVREWWRLHGRRGRLLLIERSVDGETVGLAPLYVRQRRGPSVEGLLRTVCFLGTGEPEREEVFGSHLGWLGPAPEATTRAVCRVLEARAARWDRLWLANAGPGGGTVRRIADALGRTLSESSIERVVNYRARGRDLHEYVETFEPSKHRRELRRVLRAGQASAVRWRRARDLAEARRMFGDLVALHARQWRRRGRRGACAHPRFQRFHERMLEHYVATSRLWVVGLWAGDRWLALHYDLQAGDTLYAYLAGIDPAAGRELAAGKLIMLQLFGAAWRAGLRTVELFGGYDTYKRRLTNETVETVTLDALGCSPAARVFRRLRSWKRRLRR